MDLNDIKTIQEKNPNKQPQPHIFSALARVPPTEASWDVARSILSGSRWNFSTHVNLDTGGNAGYAHTFSKGEINQVISGIAYQQLQGAKIRFGRIDHGDEGSTILLSMNSAQALNRLVPSMQLQTLKRSSREAPSL